VVDTHDPLIQLLRVAFRTERSIVGQRYARNTIRVCSVAEGLRGRPAAAAEGLLHDRQVDSIELTLRFEAEVAAYEHAASY